MTDKYRHIQTGFTEKLIAFVFVDKILQLGGIGATKSS
jgi:hypothetical protein